MNLSHTCQGEGGWTAVTALPGQRRELLIRGQPASRKPGGAQELEAPGTPEKLRGVKWLDRGMC